MIKLWVYTAGCRACQIAQLNCEVSLFLSQNIKMTCSNSYIIYNYIKDWVNWCYFAIFPKTVYSDLGFSAFYPDDISGRPKFICFLISSGTQSKKGLQCCKAQWVK